MSWRNAPKTSFRLLWNNLPWYWSLVLGHTWLFYWKFNYIVSQTIVRGKNKTLAPAREAHLQWARDACLRYGIQLRSNLYLVGSDTLKLMQKCLYHRDRYWTVTLHDFFLHVMRRVHGVWAALRVTSLQLYCRGPTPSLKQNWMKMTPRENAAFIFVLFHCLIPVNGKSSSFKPNMSHLSCLRIYDLLFQTAKKYQRCWSCGRLMVWLWKKSLILWGGENQVYFSSPAPEWVYSCLDALRWEMQFPYIAQEGVYSQRNSCNAAVYLLGCDKLTELLVFLPLLEC